MALFILDTDHTTLLQRGNQRVVERFRAVPEDAVATSIITYEEQLRGRLAVIRRADTPERLAVSYGRLREMQEFFCAIRIVDFDQDAARIYGNLRRRHTTVGTLDLRIAATALSAGATLVTRNARDFGTVDGLMIDDWSAG